jgi:hypothetical protein
MGRKLTIITLLPASYEEIVARYVTEKRRQAIEERDSFAPSRPWRQRSAGPGSRLMM